MNPAFARPLGEQVDDGVIMETLKQQQVKRRDALEHASTYHDDPELVEMLFDSVQGGAFYDAFIRLCQDILETADGDNVMVRPELTKAVQDIALQRFEGKV